MQMNFGQLQLRADAHGLAISRVDEPQLAFHLDPHSVDEFIKFVSHLSFDESYKRRAFRVPVFESKGLHVSINLENQTLDVKPRDISVIGIFVDLPYEEELELQIGECVEITIALDNLCVTCRALVRRREDNGYGLSFPDSIVNGEFCPPVDLTTIVMELQKQWIKYRETN